MRQRVVPAVRAFVGVALLVVAVAVLAQQFSVAVLPRLLVVAVAVLGGALAATGVDALARRDLR